jgi:hypothetical protein
VSFTDQKPRVATAEECSDRWGGEGMGKRFRCYLCGHRFKPGDMWRWVYSTHQCAMNFLTCARCDGSDVLARWLAQVEEAESRFWWLP